MPKLKILRLDVKGFRGVLPSKSLLFGGKSILLFGENGTGKSTFVDALEKLFTGEVQTLDHRAQGLSSQRHGPHIRNTTPAPDIAVTLTDGTKIDLTTDPSTLPSDARRYLEIAHQPIYILRRGKLLEFIESQPRDRYDLLRPYLTLSEVEDTESALAKANEQLQADLTVARTELLRCWSELTRLTGVTGNEEGLNEDKVVEAINERLARSSRERIEDIADLLRVKDSLDTDLSHFGDISKPAAMTAVIQSLEELISGFAKVRVEPFTSLVSRLREQEARQTAVIYERVLEEGARWIEQEDRLECPLCEQEMKRFPPAEVVARARGRVEQVRELLALRQEAKRESENLTAISAELLRSVERVRTQYGRNPEGVYREIDASLIDVSKRLQHLVRSLTEPPATVELVHLRDGAEVLQTGGDLNRAILQGLDTLKGQLKALPSASTAQGLLQLRESVSRISTVWQQLGTVWESYQKAQRVAKTSETALTVLQQIRKEVVAEIFTQISDDVDRIYAEMHKHHEPTKPLSASHRNIRLEVREAVQRSVNIRADFFTYTDTDPRAYYSDAHLDTLGVSIFLALRRWYRQQYPEFNLLVLDDVISSVDAGHAVRLAELLLSEFSDYQILLTTHDRIWFEHLRDIQSRCGVAQNFLNKTIYSWTINDGPDLREPEDEQRRLADLLKNGERYEIAALAGRLLEHILQEMRYALRLPIPAKPGELYEIGDLWPVFYKEIKRNYSSLYAQAQSVLDALDVSWPLRNWVGAHFNQWAVNVPLTIARAFGNAVLELFHCVFCPSCRRFIAPSSTPLGQIACKCGARIYPVQGTKSTSSTDRERIVASTAGALKDAKLTSDLHLEWKKTERSREN